MTAITPSVDLDRRGRIAVLTINNPPVNALSQHVRQGLRAGLTGAIADATVGAIVITCAGRTFIAGADITEFGKPPREPGLHEVLDLIEGSPKPVEARSEEHTSELQSLAYLVCRLLLEKKKKKATRTIMWLMTVMRWKFTISAS